ncbi:unnamed protein product, partial [Amoebophrya sp. A25]|eukprot:GSA25T00004052001.1
MQYDDEGADTRPLPCRRSLRAASGGGRKRLGPKTAIMLPNSKTTMLTSGSTVGSSTSSSASTSSDYRVRSTALPVPPTPSPSATGSGGTSSSSTSGMTLLTHDTDTAHDNSLMPTTSAIDKFNKVTDLTPILKGIFQRNDRVTNKSKHTKRTSAKSNKQNSKIHRNDVLPPFNKGQLHAQEGQGQPPFRGHGQRTTAASCLEEMD